MLAQLNYENYLINTHLLNTLYTKLQKGKSKII